MQVNLFETSWKIRKIFFGSWELQESQVKIEFDSVSCASNPLSKLNWTDVEKMSQGLPI